MSEEREERPVEQQEADERHASWAELFFDLVAVAGVGVLAHVLHGEVGPLRLGLYVVLFAAFWLTWITFTLYGNTAGGRTRTVRLLVAMFGLAVMAASVPGIAEDVVHEGLDGSHGPMVNAFAIAYVVTRLFGAGSWTRGQVVLDWPVAQQTVGAIPWLASIWVDEPWKFALWALGIVLDILVIAVFSPGDALHQLERRVEAVKERHGDDAVRMPSVGAVALDPAHLGERLGLFVIIVLGEGVILGVRSASGATWDGQLLRTGLAAFVLLASMWALSVLYGYAGVPHLLPGALPLRRALALHAGVTATIAAVAAGLGDLVAQPPGPVAEHLRWLLCAAMATYFALGILAALLSGGFQATRILLWSATGIAVPLLVAGLAPGIVPARLAALLAAISLGHLVYELQRSRTERDARLG